MTLGLTVDAALALLLVVTIAYCAAVHRRLGAIRAAQADMRALADRLAAAGAQAEAGLGQLRVVAAEAADGLGPRIKTARRLAGDLDMLCHRADKLAERLDRTQAPSRARAAGLAAQHAARRSRSEHALIEALKAKP
ncbi:MAG TPA: DUF6468 domain-containing protein [Alphaproteobacteria bacterium]